MSTPSYWRSCCSTISRAEAAFGVACGVEPRDVGSQVTAFVVSGAGSQCPVLSRRLGATKDAGPRLRRRRLSRRRAGGLGGRRGGAAAVDGARHRGGRAAAARPVHGDRGRGDRGADRRLQISDHRTDGGLRGRAGADRGSARAIRAADGGPHGGRAAGADGCGALRAPDPVHSASGHDRLHCRHRDRDRDLADQGRLRADDPAHARDLPREGARLVAGAWLGFLGRLWCGRGHVGASAPAAALFRP